MLTDDCVLMGVYLLQWCVGVADLNPGRPTLPLS